VHVHALQEFASRVAAEPPAHVVTRMRGLSADAVTVTPAGVLMEIVHHCSVFIIRCNHKCASLWFVSHCEQRLGC
jgi:hypothetical protein